MMGRRRAIPIFLLLLLVLFGTVMQIVGGAAAVPSATRQAPVGATPTPTPTTGRARAVVRSLVAVEAAFNAGDVALLCRPGRVVDPAVTRQQNAHSGGCESELETLIANARPMRLVVRHVALRKDLATTTVTTATGTTVPVDLIRHGRDWLLSFSQGGDPISALAGEA
jgi:hypothetical protein